MSNFFMGVELGAEELILGTPVPSAIPPEGVIIPRTESDGWTRKYLHQMGKNPICIAEIAPAPGAMLAGPQIEAPAPPPAPAPASYPQSAMSLLPVSSPVPMSQPVRVPLPGSNSPFMIGGPVQIRGAESPVPTRPALGSPVSSLNHEISAARQPLRLGQTIPGMPAVAPAPAPGGRQLSMILGEAAAPLPAASEAAPPADPTCGICPTGPLQLQDGKIIQLDDPITLKDLCLMMPSILKAIPCGPPGAQPGIPTQPYGQGPMQVQKASGGGFPSFGPASGMWGGGGGGGGGGGLPGPLGVVNQAAPQGAGAPGGVGPVGPQGPPGAGSVIDFVTKTDGDFLVGAGALVPVPGTLISFTQGVDGNVLFVVNAAFAGLSGLLENNHNLGIQIDGTLVISLQKLTLGFFNFGPPPVLPASASWAGFLAAGPHTVEVMFTDGTLAANTTSPLVLSVAHS